MTKEEILKKAKVIQFPNNGDNYTWYSLPNKHIYQIPLIEGSRYKDFPYNENHYNSEYHLHHVIPLLVQILDLPFNEEDFTIGERKAHNDKITLQYYVPKKEYEFEAWGLENNEHLEKCSFTDLMTYEGKGNGITEYHSLYRYPHSCSYIINHSLPEEGRKILITGDSQMIPDIPFLCCFFRELWYMDRRDMKPFPQGIKERFNVTDILIELFTSYFEKYIGTNIDLLL